jgi:hypothetical protein
MRSGPELSARRSEEKLIARQGRGILRTILALLGGSAASWIVMQRFAQDCSAPHIPVVAGIGQMKMPDFIDFLARRDRRGARYGKESKAAVFQDRRAGEFSSPIMIARARRLVKSSASSASNRWFPMRLHNSWSAKSQIPGLIPSMDVTLSQSGRA